jgi:hypothetical protein
MIWLGVMFRSCEMVSNRKTVNCAARQGRMRRADAKAAASAKERPARRSVTEATWPHGRGSPFVGGSQETMHALHITSLLDGYA